VLIKQREVEEPSTYRFGTRRAKGFALSHQEAIACLAAAEGILVPEAPKAMLSIRGLASAIGADWITIAHMYADMVREGIVPEANTFKFGSRTAPGLPLGTQRSIALKLCEAARVQSTRENAARFLEELDKHETSQLDDL
jgi:DNA-binding transcriptional regulator YhcF (GntR family)